MESIESKDPGAIDSEAMSRRDLLKRGLEAVGITGVATVFSGCKDTRESLQEAKLKESVNPEIVYTIAAELTRRFDREGFQYFNYLFDLARQADSSHSGPLSDELVQNISEELAKISRCSINNVKYNFAPRGIHKFSCRGLEFVIENFSSDQIFIKLDVALSDGNHRIEDLSIGGAGRSFEHTIFVEHSGGNSSVLLKEYDDPPLSKDENPEESGRDYSLNPPVVKRRQFTEFAGKWEAHRPIKMLGVNLTAEEVPVSAHLIYPDGDNNNDIGAFRNLVYARRANMLSDYKN